MDWDMPMSGQELSSEPLTVAGYKRTLQSPSTVYCAMQIGSIAKPKIEDIFKLDPEHFGRLLIFADKMSIPHSQLLEWTTDYIVWSESEDFIER
jgi:hypothetical protein